MKIWDPKLALLCKKKKIGKFGIPNCNEFATDFLWNFANLLNSTWQIDLGVFLLAWKMLKIVDTA